MNTNKRTSSEMDFATQALKEGYTLEEIKAFLGLTNARVSTNVGATTKVETTTNNTTSKSSKAPRKEGKGKGKGNKKGKGSKAKNDAPKLVVGGYGKVLNSKDKSVAFVGLIKAITTKDNEKFVEFEGDRTFGIANCVAITKATFGKLKKSLDKAASKKANKGSKRVEFRQYVGLRSVLAHAEKPEYGFYEFAKEAHGNTLTDKELSDINSLITQELPNLKLNAKVANKLLELQANQPDIAPSQLHTAYVELTKKSC